MEASLLLNVDRSPLHGQGCFAAAGVAAGATVARARILVFPPEEMTQLFGTRLKHYLFYLRDGASEDGPFWTALAMGPISFCNHADPPNCDFMLDEAAEEIRLVARQALRQGEEVTISYGDWAEEII